MSALTAMLLLSAGGADACPLGPKWGTQALEEPANRLRFDRDLQSLTWNGAPASEAILRQYFAAIGKDARRRLPLVIDTTGMPCAQQRRLAEEADALSTCTPALCRAYAMPRRPIPPAPPAPPAARRH